MTETPVRVSGPDELRALNQRRSARYPFLLQSTASGGDLGRFDILFAFPGESLVLHEPGSLDGPYSEGQRRFLAALDRWWSAEKLDGGGSELPFRGGWFLYLGYELASEIETSLSLHKDPLLPTAFAVRCSAALVYDHAKAACYFVDETHRREAPGRLDQVLADIAALDVPEAATGSVTASIDEDDPSAFTDAVSAAKQYIEAGDVYQANLSRQWNAVLAGELRSESIYRALCESNPAPFAGIARWRDAVIISSSPERLLHVRDGCISTRPIAGTRPRGDSASSDDHLSTELFSHPKERAEHVMLIDLERNDLGRVCTAGSVVVDEMMALETYAHVHHIVSNVRGRLRADVTPGEAIAAVFPGGTITGCPKVRCMEIIDELEGGARGAYTGSFGYLNRDGGMDLNILIRTMVQRGREVTFRAGAGIVADSDPAAELEETRAKAEGLLRALRYG